MAGMRMMRIIAAGIAGSMIFSSTGAIAAAAPAASSQQVSPWAALTALSAGAPAAALCGSAAAGCALQTADVAQPATDGGPPPPPPPADAVPAMAGDGGYVVSPLLIALGVVAFGTLAYFLLRNHHHHTVSPA